MIYYCGCIYVWLYLRPWNLRFNHQLHVCDGNIRLHIMRPGETIETQKKTSCCSRLVRCPPVAVPINRSPVETTKREAPSHIQTGSLINLPWQSRKDRLFPASLGVVLPCYSHRVIDVGSLPNTGDPNSQISDWSFLEMFIRGTGY